MRQPSKRRLFRTGSALGPHSDGGSQPHAGRPALGGPIPLALAAWMAGNIIAYLLLALAIRQLKLDLTFPEILAIRSAGGLAIGIVLGFRDPTLFHEVWKSQLPLHLSRSALHAVGSLAVVWSVANLPLGLVASIDFSGPLFAAAVGIVGFRLWPARWSWIGLAFILTGATIIVLQNQDALGPAIIIPFIGVGVLTSTNILLAVLSRTQSTRSILFLMNATQLVIFGMLSVLGADRLNLPSAALAGAAALPHGSITLALAIIAVAASGYLTQASLSQATRHGTVVQVSALDTLRIPTLAVAGALILDEPLNRGLIVPAIVIMGGAILTAILDRSR